MDQKIIIEKTAAHIQEVLSDEGSGHDWWHIHRVWQLAKRIAKEEEVDGFIVELAALLHDIADHKAHGGDTDIGPATARKWLEGLSVDPLIVDHVCEIIRDLSFKGSEVQTPMHSPEGAVVQDADRLDAIGAIGIARAFAYGGHKGRLLFDPNILPEKHHDFESYKNNENPTLNHFYEKLLLLKDRMNTPTAKWIAHGRHVYMQKFIREFLTEWQGKDA